MTPALTPDGDLLITIFNGYGDAYLALPVLRAIGRQFCGRSVYLAGYRSEIEALFQDLPFIFVPGDLKNGRIVLDHDIEALSFSRLMALNNYFPLCSVDASLVRRYPSIPRWAMFDWLGRPQPPLSTFQMHIRDQYFAILGWQASYSPVDRQVFIPEAARAAADQHIATWAARHGEGWYVLHVDTAPEKMWPVGQWIDLAMHIWAQLRAWPLLVGGSTPDTAAVTGALRFACKLPPEIGLSAHLAAVRRANAFVGVDSVFAHVADSFSKPAVVLFRARVWCPNGWRWLRAPWTRVWGPVGPHAYAIQPVGGEGMIHIALEHVGAAVALALHHGLKADGGGL